MREILFRAKRKNWRDLPKEEWWVEGYYCYFMEKRKMSTQKHILICYDLLIAEEARPGQHGGR